MHPLQNKVLRVAAVSGKREVVLKGVVLDVKDGVICLSIKNEDDLIIKERSSGTPAAPGKWDGPNKRAFFRLPTAVSAMVGPRQPTIACQVVNVSGSGICFRTSVQFQLNEVVKLRVSLTDEDTFLFTCQVVRSRNRLSFSGQAVFSHEVSGIFQPLHQPRKLFPGNGTVGKGVANIVRCIGGVPVSGNGLVYPTLQIFVYDLFHAYGFPNQLISSFVSAKPLNFRKSLFFFVLHIMG